MRGVCIRAPGPESTRGLQRKQLLFFCFVSVAVDDLAVCLALCRVDIADKQRNAVVGIQAGPEQIGKAVDIIGDRDELGLADKARQRVAVADIGVNEMSLSRDRILVGEGEALAGGGVAVCALENGERVVEAGLLDADDAGDSGV